MRHDDLDRAAVLVMQAPYYNPTAARERKHFAAA